jgi:hypothetical protein
MLAQDALMLATRARCAKAHCYHVQGLVANTDAASTLLVLQTLELIIAVCYGK